MATSPDAIFIPPTSYTSGWRAADEAVANSVQTALTARQIHTYQWANAAARTAQAGMAEGDVGYQADTDLTYQYNGSAWKLWQKLSTAFTPTWTNLTIGSATQAWVYSISAGLVTVQGVTTLSASTMGAAYMALPVTAASGYVADQAIGTATYIDAGAAVYDGRTLVKIVSTVAYASFTAVNAAATYATAAALSSTVPFTWGNTDYISATYSYQAA